MDAHPDCVIVGTGVVVVDGNNKERYRYLKSETDAAIRESALSANPFTHSAVLYRKSAALAEGGYERQYAEDWALWLAMGKKGTLYNIPAYSTGFLMAGQNKTLVHQRAHAKALVGIVMRFRNDYPHFFRGYAVNLAALLFSYVPFFARKALFPLAARIKRLL